MGNNGADVKRVSILYILLACLAGLLSACGGSSENTSTTQLNLSVDPTSLPDATVNMPYNLGVAIMASGGTVPYLYSCSVVNGGGLSASVSYIDPVTGVAFCEISGTPLTEGPVTLIISASDNKKVKTSEENLSIIINSEASPLDNWHLRNPSSQGSTLSNIVYGNEIFVAIGVDGIILTSSDGATWTSRNSGTKHHLYSVAYGNDTFVATGEGGIILTSSDGVMWTLTNSGTRNYLYGVTYGNGTFVVVGYPGTILTSQDGVTWASRNPGTNEQAMIGVTYSNDTFVIVGGHGTILTSPDGVAWISRNSGTSNELYGVTHGNGTFVAVGHHGSIILISTNGRSWTPKNSGVNAHEFLMGVTYGNGTFVAVGGHGTIVQSDPME
jgi:photosystem II stability/assembly factor-like uncharacterized protein